MEKIPLKKKRMLLYFIEATQSIIESDGFDNVTIRKISKKAGYNSSTLYNYYEDLDHLLQFACIEYLIEYQKKLIEKIKYLTDSKQIYFQTWSIFLNECYKHPKVYYHLFFSKYKNQIHNTFYRYLDLFNIEYGEVPNTKIYTFTKLPGLIERHKILLEAMVNQGYISGNQIEEKTEIIVMIIESLLNSIRNGFGYSFDELEKRILKFVKIVLGLK